jgi:hypothetical protein
MQTLLPHGHERLKPNKKVSLEATASGDGYAGGVGWNLRGDLSKSLSQQNAKKASGNETEA